MTDTYKPSWRPDNNDDKFACRVMRGVEGGHDGTPGMICRNLSGNPFSIR